MKPVNESAVLLKGTGHSAVRCDDVCSDGAEWEGPTILSLSKGARIEKHFPFGPQDGALHASRLCQYLFNDVALWETDGGQRDR